MLFKISLPALLLVVATVPIPCYADTIVNDISQLNPIQVADVATPHSETEVIDLVRQHHGPIAISGGRNSMGGQTATEQALVLDMRQLNQIENLDLVNKEVTVQAGMTWHALQEALDPHGLSVRIMQTYANFTIGGSLSVNVHGRYVGQGPMILSVKSLRLVLANGEALTVSPQQNAELFYAAIGGYGGIGVITSATLQLADNTKVERQDEVMPLSAYQQWFEQHIAHNPQVIFHNADLYPNDFNRVRAVSYVETNKPLTVKEHLIAQGEQYPAHQAAFWAISEWPSGKNLREYVLDPLLYLKNPVEWRNYEASYDTRELEPRSRQQQSYVLQEYFVPTTELDNFVGHLHEILNRYQVNTINVSIRHAKQDSGSLLAWAKTDVFALVLYYKQGTDAASRDAVGVWTRELIDAALASHGSYYLPYQPHATSAQFATAYPNANQFFALKQRVDPDYKFRNKLWDKYYVTWLNQQQTEPTQNTVPTTESRFKKILGNPRYNDDLFLFLQNVYGLYPPAEFHQLINRATAEHATDGEIYQAIQHDLPAITPKLWSLRYGLPALKKQRAEIARESSELLGTSSAPINGYLEIGTTGRYVNALQKKLPIHGPLYVMNDETSPDYSPMEIAERGQLRKIGKFLKLNDYEPIPRNQIADESLDMVSIYIGLHHAPPEKLSAFIDSVWRVLRPNGKLLIRDHDVDSAEFNEFVSLIHDAFYSGLDKDWNYSSHEIRLFTSANQLTATLQQHGFQTDGRRLLQPHDPSRNTLMLFSKQERANDVEHATHLELKQQAGYQRDEGQTYLTFPEWFLVYNPDEYARYLAAGKAPSDFPYWRSVGQFWSYYGKVSRITNQSYDFNGGYHLMVSVLGASYTVENAIKSGYENTIGRTSELLSTRRLTTEDELAADVAQDYVKFIRVRPWYEYSFSKQLGRLWFKTSPIGRNPLRKLERRVILTEEYLEKAMYATLITGATRLIYGVADDTVLAVIEPVPSKKLEQISAKIHIIKTLANGHLLIALPRYEEFRDAVLAMSQQGIIFDEIAGNQKILISALTDAIPPSLPPHMQLEMHKPVLTQTPQQRMLLTADIRYLHESLPQLQAATVEIEHLYDY